MLTAHEISFILLSVTQHKRKVLFYYSDDSTQNENPYSHFTRQKRKQVGEGGESKHDFEKNLCTLLEVLLVWAFQFIKSLQLLRNFKNILPF